MSRATRTSFMLLFAAFAPASLLQSWQQQISISYCDGSARNVPARPAEVTLPEAMAATPLPVRIPKQSCACSVSLSGVGVTTMIDLAARTDHVTLCAAPGEPSPSPDAENRTKPPLASPDLTERAEHLFRSITDGDPALGDDFFFPREPFIPLKDVQDPGRYHAQLLATYHRDIQELHQKRKDWSGASFESFELGTAPTWVAPGKEYNKIGYYRTFHGKLRYRVAERTSEIDVGTIISWDGRWYATHLLPIRH